MLLAAVTANMVLMALTVEMVKTESYSDIAMIVRGGRSRQ